MLNLCTVEGCDNLQKARTFCTKHYKRWQKHGNPLGSGGSERPAIRKHEILDLLQISGGWWTIPHIAERLEINRSTVQKALYEFSQLGLVRRRKLGDRGTDRPEWKAT
jgi:Fic family protein